jgi:membrane-associated phospholipid phosphatase
MAINTAFAMTKSVIIFFCFLLCAFNAKAQGDSTILYKENKAPITVKMDRKEFNLNRLHHSCCVAAPVAAVGLAVWPADKAINRRVMDGIPSFRTKVDDYLRFAPLAAQLGMSLGGVQGHSRNRWQVLATDAMAGAMMMAAVGGIKYSIDRTRPNGEGAGFPSGHTATAFLGATLLSHEYGHKSVWIPIAGYSVATATGALRILNNKHYASDVVVGAAVGILAAELSYWASDAIFNNRKLFQKRRARLHQEVLKNY